MKNKGRSFVSVCLALILALTVFVTGCSNKTDGGQANEGSSKITFTDLDGKSHTFDKPVNKVIVNYSGSGGAFLTMAALLGEDLPNHLANLDDGLSSNRYDVWEQFSKDMPKLKDLPDFGDYGDGTFDIEAAIASSPDCVINTIEGNKPFKEQYQQKFESAGIPVVYIDYHSETLENHTKSIEIIGKLFGKDDRANEIIKWYTEKHNGITNRVDAILKTKQRPKVHMEVASAGPSAAPKGYSNNYMWGKIVHKAGGEPIGASLNIATMSEIQPEQVLSANPEKIFLYGAYWPKQTESVRLGYITEPADTKATMQKFVAGRAGWNELTAVKNGDVYTISHVLPRDIWSIVALEATAKSIWPEEFKNDDPHKTLEEFFTKFLPFKYGGTWYLKL